MPSKTQIQQENYSSEKIIFVRDFVAKVMHFMLGTTNKEARADTSQRWKS